ncbi:hypothetical protein [Azospirillum sp. TSA6c]|uniref:hypothetical protein n=1 Tax=unclassified Azospirillum TaxID=2630922 RepID=UPI0018EEBE9F|nr:hypothetical protein [Azospirillum sp. TSA6c]
MKTSRTNRFNCYDTAVRDHKKLLHASLHGISGWRRLQRHQPDPRKVRENRISRATSELLENRRKRMSSLLAHADTAVKAWAEGADRKLAQWADAERKAERERSQREQSFE